MSERLLTVREVAEYLQMSRDWVSQHAAGVRRPQIPSIKMGKAVRFRREDLAQFIEECRRAGA